MAAEAESWDADFADGAAKEERADVLLPARLRERAALGHEVDEDWDADFDGAPAARGSACR